MWKEYNSETKTGLATTKFFRGEHKNLFFAQPGDVEWAFEPRLGGKKSESGARGSKREADLLLVDISSSAANAVGTPGHVTIGPPQDLGGDNEETERKEGTKRGVSLDSP